MTAFDSSTARKAMIDSQLRTSGVNEEFVLGRMNAVAREEFVPDEQRSMAYIDRAIPLGDGRYLASPVVHGMMLTESAPNADDSVLVVDSGSGYFAELMTPLVQDVARATIAEALSGDAKTTHSLVVVEGAIEDIPASLTNRIADNGRIVTGIVERGVTRLAVGRKIAGTVSMQAVADVGIPVLHEFDAPKSWSFA